MFPKCSPKHFFIIKAIVIQINPAGTHPPDGFFLQKNPNRCALGWDSTEERQMKKTTFAFGCFYYNTFCKKNQGLSPRFSDSWEDFRLFFTLSTIFLTVNVMEITTGKNGVNGPAQNAAYAVATPTIAALLKSKPRRPTSHVGAYRTARTIRNMIIFVRSFNCFHTDEKKVLNFFIVAFQNVLFRPRPARFCFARA